MCERTRATRTGCLFVGLFHLAHDLRFAHHHAVQAGSDVEQVPHGVFAGALEQIVKDLARFHVVKFGQELDDILVRGTCRVFRDGRVNFDPIAGREDNRFGVGKPSAKTLQRRR